MILLSLTEVLFFEALNHAKRLDEYMSKFGKPIGPLHGVPMTLKDQFDVQGYDTTIGYTARALKPASADSVLVKMLRKLGAVVIAKTNLPQSIMVCTCVLTFGRRIFSDNTVVRDGEPSLGADYKPNELEVYAGGVNGRRVCVDLYEREPSGLGNRYRR